MTQIFKLKTGVFLMLLCASVFCHAQQSYISKYKEVATQLSKEYGIPTAIILSIAYVETGGGSSAHSKILHNHFGMVGKNTVNKSRFRSFENAEASYRAFCQMITRKKYYATLKGDPDHKNWVTAIAAAGYSTKPNEWKQKIHMIINRFGL